MKMLKEWGLKIGFLILISSIIGIAQEVQAAPRIPFNEHVGIEFDIKKYDGTPYKDAQVLVDLKEESSKPTVVNNFLEIGGVSTKDVLITSTNGHYVHNYGLFDMGSVFYYPPVWTDHSFHYAYYTNLRLLPGRHIKKLEVGDYYYLIKTWYYDKSYNYTKFVDNDRVLNSPSQKIVSLANGAFLYKDENLLTGYHDRPQVEFGGISMSTWRDESNTYQNTSTDTFGRNISFIVTPCQGP
ncbi:hypothetical protein [Enterococcus malodoratus]|uniref:Uncharacterized protein n=1 Tax=Enterococcus malodoratus ATCC 43197 TaxID=1158601 RepID=R2QZ96_9ENTE|nr:hypothetical protein [Enterococcus malodoratus]EOH76750.1 hypothetical protein UAI_02425 [Enterococcus malodoratus ATCC 43197]EOT63549.1 hypothetical protein I585_04379 [Enterococcus malodoratus ATCC 43197]OJG64955.1 hypothetical protein RV07_GL003409 [Enterococcus malodoratus]SPW69308.1 Uncharacterised protein [Enterococcus malodoratus]STD65870.1 Uncharacterised protein [Enterococcus malodoratus]